MKSMKFAVLATLSAVALSTAAQAADYLSLNVGEFAALRRANYHAGQFGAEYRFDEMGYGIHPIVGGFITSHDSTYGYGGFNWDVALLKNELYLVPNFAVGAYSKGNGKDLGGALEFRSGIELDYQFVNAQQVGVALNHISNAGIYSHNGGEETIMATYSIPVGTIKNWLHF